MFKYIVLVTFITLVHASSEYLNPEEHYGLHTQAISSGPGAITTAHSSNDEPNNTPLVTEDPEEEEQDSQEDVVEPQHIVQYIRVKYIPQPVYKYVQATPPPTPIPTPSVQENIVKYVQHRQRLVKYIPTQTHHQTQIVKYMPAPAQRIIKIVPQRIVKVPQRIVKVLKYVPYNPEQQQHHHEQHIQKITYKATPAPLQQQQQQQPQHQQQYIPTHQIATVSLPAYHTADQVILTGPAYEHSSITRRSHHEQNIEQQH